MSFGWGYAPGTEFDKSAPWNQSAEPEPKWEVCEKVMIGVTVHWCATDGEEYDDEEDAEKALIAYLAGYELADDDQPPVLEVRGVYP